MNTVTIDGERLKNMMTYAVYLLNKNRDELDSLNIFPVPDGDTGTNMSLTSLAALKELEKLGGAGTLSCDDVAKAVASGSLRGARGNSGVILSQLFRGFSKGFKDKAEVTTADFTAAFQQSTTVAYKAVMKPQEGTVLTISRALAEKAAELTPEVTAFEEFFPPVIAHAKEMLAQTTYMLPALKAAGVVDAGGKGLLYLIEGMFEGLSAAAPEVLEAETTGSTTKSEPVFSGIDTADIKFAYCTEFFIEKKNYPENKMTHLTAFLEKLGDSIVAVGSEEIIKIHVHTNHPGTVLERALQIGPLSNVKIENMRIQHTSMINGKEAATPAEPQETPAFVPRPAKVHAEFGIIAVSVGEGINDIFGDLGCDYIISGGQSMNPSAEDFVQAAKAVGKRKLIFLPNNKNIIMAAQQAAAILKKEDQAEAQVLATKSIPQGIGAMIAMVHDKPFEETVALMEQGAKSIRTGLVTEAVKDTEIDGKSIKTGDYLGLIEGKIEAVSIDALGAAKAVIDYFSDTCELVSIFYGDRADEAEGQELCAYVEERGLESELQYGGQPVYSYVISAE